MMSRSALLGATFLAPVFLLASVSLGSADDAPIAKATSTFSMKPNTDGEQPLVVTTVNTRFETDQLLPTVGPDVGKVGIDIYQLVEVEETHVNKEGPNSDGERVAGKVKATVYPLDKTTGKGAAKFTIESEGDQTTVDGPYLTITRWGCCESQATNAVYSLETGKYLFNSVGVGQSGQWADVTSHNFQRILAYHTAPTEMDDVILKGAPNAAIVIAYATSSAPLQRVLVTVPKEVLEGDDGIIGWDPKLQIFNKQFPKPSDHIWTDKVDADPAKVMTGITVQLTLDPKHKVVIPLVGDKLQLDQAKLPKDWGVVEAPL
jgi:hypothetical protein